MADQTIVRVYIVGGYNFPVLRKSYVRAFLVDAQAVSRAHQTLPIRSPIPRWFTVLSFVVEASMCSTPLTVRLDAYVSRRLHSDRLVGSCFVPVVRTPSGHGSRHSDDLSAIVSRGFEAFVHYQSEQWFDLVANMPRIQCPPTSSINALDAVTHSSTSSIQLSSSSSSSSSSSLSLSFDSPGATATHKLVSTQSHDGEIARRTRQRPQDGSIASNTPKHEDHQPPQSPHALEASHNQRNNDGSDGDDDGDNDDDSIKGARLYASAIIVTIPTITDKSNSTTIDDEKPVTLTRVSRVPGESLRRGSMIVVVNATYKIDAKDPRLAIHTGSQRLQAHFIDGASKAIYIFSILEGDDPVTELACCYRTDGFMSVNATDFKVTIATPPCEANDTSTDAISATKLFTSTHAFEQAQFDITVKSFIDHVPVPITIKTERFHELFHEIVESKRSKGRLIERYPELKGLHFLLVGGLFTDHYPGYMLKNKKRLDQLHIPYTRVPINSDATCDSNAQVIISTIKQQVTAYELLHAPHQSPAADSESSVACKRFVLIGHSKAGADIHVAITTAPEVQSYLYGIILLQGVMSGVGLLDLPEACSQYSNITNKIESWIPGVQWHGVEQLSYLLRSAYTREHPWPSAIPTVCLASQYRFRDPSRKALSSLSSAMAQSMRKSSDIICSYTGFESDGLVIKADACVAGSDVVFLKDMNHSEPAIAVPGTKYPPGIVQEALMYLLIELVRRRSLSVHS